MHSISHSLRSGSFAAAAATALLVMTAPAALAGGDDAVATIDAYECTSIDVTSTKAISNVVLEFADGDRQRFEDLGEEETGTFAGTGDDSGEVITAAWIKSGDNSSGDGPGYGERKDFDSTTCDTGDAGETRDAGETGDTGTGDTGTAGDDTGSAGDDTGTAGNDGDDTAGSDTAGTDEGDTGDAGSSETATGPDAGTGAAADVQPSTGTDTDADRDDSTQGEAQPTGTEVLGVVLERDLDDTHAAPSTDDALGAAQDRGLNAAAGTQIRGADTLADAGADTLTTLGAALAALGLGAGLLRRARRTT